MATNGEQILLTFESERKANMPKIGIIYGMENTFPSALVDRINSKGIPDVVAEHIRTGGVKMA